ncbi:MAG: hypothetical protein EU539_00215 [Promethearchaeota archaeon]|nr:MAG: hypothetical protein EU539_00215 [Candidatus Lokiarchaeota archaeon]
MLSLIKIVSEQKLVGKDQSALDQLKSQKNPCFISEGVKVYKNSLYIKNNILYFIAKLNEKKCLYLVSNKPFKSEFFGNIEKINSFYTQQVEMNYKNSLILKKIFPFTAPISLREKRTSFGCGDRLGLATPGHIRAAIQYDVYPVLAQQSIRELNLTNRNYKQVTSDVAFSVFQEGYERGYGADGDHLKTIKDIDIALEAGMPMITLDLTNVLHPEVMNWNEEKVNEEFDKIEINEKKRILNTYADKEFNIKKVKLIINNLEAKQCALLYQEALNFAQEVDEHLKKHRGDKYDLEISIDETTTPTLPIHHLFIINELNYRKITINSLAPKFIGDFQKAIDYIGDIEEFEKSFKIHCEIADNYGKYKISIHSGSDKFSVYPLIGKYTDLHFHLKTAGTSWLEALKCIAQYNPKLYRKIHAKAFEYYQEALKFYHITADISKIKSIEKVNDNELIKYFNKDESRQLLHITYGGLLSDPEIRKPFFDTLNEFEEEHYQIVSNHISKHMELLGMKKIK